MDTPAPKYDVAISFLSQDQPIATALHDLLSTGLKVFFYPRNQEDLAGTDGLESMRQPFVDDSLVTVVLYRERWAKTAWTRVEEAAIKDGCLKHGWQRLFFMPLDNTTSFPVWLPHTHVRFNYEYFGLKEAVGAIKARVLDSGGTIVPETALSRARVVHAEAEHKRKKERLFGSAQWLQENVRPSISAIFDEVSRIAKEVSVQAGLAMRMGSLPNEFMMTNGVVSLIIIWSQNYTNVIGELHIQEFHNSIILPGERQGYLTGRPPAVAEQHKFLPELSIDESLCWKSDDRPDERLSTGELAEHAVKLFIALIHSANRGEIDTTPEFVRKLRERHEDEDDRY